MKNPTPYRDVNEIIALLTRDLKTIFGSQIAGLYLTGSLTYGDFDRDKSDLDFYGILEKEFSPGQREQVKDMHANIEKLYPKWAHRIEIPYVLRSVLGSVEPPKMSRPIFNAGELWNPDPPFGDNWLINLYVVRECGVALIGPDPKSLIEPIDIDDVREASRRDLHGRWEQKINSSQPFGDEKHWDISLMQAFTVLTMCRILYRAKNDDVASKRAAAKWVKENYGVWSGLIEKAEKWERGKHMNIGAEAVDFVKFTLHEVE